MVQEEGTVVYEEGLSGCGGGTQLILERDTVVKGKQSSLGGGTHWFWGWDTIFLKRGTQWFRGEARWFRRRTSVVLGAGQNCS